MSVSFLFDLVASLGAFFLVFCVFYLLIVLFKGYTSLGALRAGSGVIPESATVDKNVVDARTRDDTRDMSEAIKRMGAINVSAKKLEIVDLVGLKSAVARANASVLPSASDIKAARDGVLYGVTQPGQSMAENMQGMRLEVAVAPQLQDGYKIVADVRGRVTYRYNGRIVSKDRAYGIAAAS